MKYLYIFDQEGNLIDEDSPDKVCKRFDLTMCELKQRLKEQTPINDKGHIVQTHEEFFDFESRIVKKKEAVLIFLSETEKDEDFFRNQNFMYG